ncbi:hypothetical protein DMC30DRAFT_417778 [Rhodotorula diobovata]|uniref:Uncharacterized protein n=1 Tax=Rhodotorula diobovata TaxID=5288 RepID=A0A5C5FTJ5_9BASI|nr:hypothetical protein DMC30DRAFT_417778 [Rhodotorula diobovata]
MRTRQNCKKLTFASSVKSNVVEGFQVDPSRGQTWWKIPIHLACGLLIQPFASLAEGLSAIWAMASEDFGKFEVIVKK